MEEPQHQPNPSDRPEAEFDLHYDSIVRHHESADVAAGSLSRSRSSRSGRGSALSRKETRDPDLDINLPYRTLSPNANLDEYRTERPEGEIPGPLEADGEHRYKLVAFTPDDPENPKNWSKPLKWYITMVIAITCFVVAFCSSVITADLIGVSNEFDVSNEVALLTITVFVVGFGVGTCFIP